MTDPLDDKDFDFKAGYHAAMTEIAQLALKITKEKEKIHDETPGGFFVGPKPIHHKCTGALETSKRIGDHAFKRANYAFLTRNKRG